MTMKLLVAVGAAAYFSLAAAQGAQLQDLPECAQGCAIEGIPQDCGIDVACICSSESFLDAISCCVSKACEAEDQKSALEFARNICEPAGVTDLPTEATCADDTAAATTDADEEEDTSATMTDSAMSDAEPTEAAEATEDASTEDAEATEIAEGTEDASAEDTEATETASSDDSESTDESDSADSTDDASSAEPTPSSSEEDTDASSTDVPTEQFTGLANNLAAQAMGAMAVAGLGAIALI